MNQTDALAFSAGTSGMAAGGGSNAAEARIVAAYARRSRAVPADRYSHFEQGDLMLRQSRERHALKLLAEQGCRPLETKKIFEVGCGTGTWLRDFIRWGAQPDNLAGIDLLPDSVDEARRLCPAAVQLRCGSAAAIDFPDGSFDVVLQSTVFTSVLDAELKAKIAGEMLRLAKPDGLILWYDFRVDNPRNRDVKGVGKREIRRLFPDCQITLKPMILVPPLARFLGRYSLLACYLLECLPWLCTHYMGAIRKREETAN